MVEDIFTSPNHTCVTEIFTSFQSGSVDVLHCYYAHGEGNENFQRRSYWMLEE